MMRSGTIGLRSSKAALRIKAFVLLQKLIHNLKRQHEPKHENSEIIKTLADMRLCFSRRLYYFAGRYALFYALSKADRTAILASTFRGNICL